MVIKLIAILLALILLWWAFIAACVLVWLAMRIFDAITDYLTHHYHKLKARYIYNEWRQRNP